MRMKTPMYNHLFKTDYTLSSDFSKTRLAEEKAFAKKCFEAGRLFGMDLAMSTEWGDDTTKPDFDEFYKQFESVSSTD